MVKRCMFVFLKISQCLCVATQPMCVKSNTLWWDITQGCSASPTPLGHYDRDRETIYTHFCGGAETVPSSVLRSSTTTKFSGIGISVVLISSRANSKPCSIENPYGLAYSPVSATITPIEIDSGISVSGFSIFCVLLQETKTTVVMRMAIRAMCRFFSRILLCLSEINGTRKSFWD